MSIPGKIEHILVFALKRVGEILVTTPLIRGLAKSYPNANIEVVIDNYYKDVLLKNPYIDALHLLRPHEKPLQIFEKAREFNARSYSITIDVLANPRSAFLTLAAHAPVRIGLNKRVRKYSYNRYFNSFPRATRYVADRRLNALRLLGKEPDGLKLDFFVAASGRRRGRKLLSQNGIDPDRPFITASPVSQKHYKLWPYDSFAIVLENIQFEYGLPIVLLCGPGEYHHLDKMDKAMRNAVDAKIECLSFDILGAILAHSSLLIANDSGIRHLAMATDTPTIGIFGSGNKYRWTPPSHPYHQALSAPLGCRQSKCHRTCQFEYKCLEMVTPSEVFEVSRSILERLRRKSQEPRKKQ